MEKEEVQYAQEQRKEEMHEMRHNDEAKSYAKKILIYLRRLNVDPRIIKQMSNDIKDRSVYDHFVLINTGERDFLYDMITVSNFYNEREGTFNDE